MYCIRCLIVCKISFTNWNALIPLLRASMVLTYYIKLFQSGGWQTQRYFNVSSPSSRRDNHHFHLPGYFQKRPPEVFCKKDVLKNFVNFIGKHRCWSFFLIKLQTCSSATLLKRHSNTGVFVNIFKNTFLRTPGFFQEFNSLILLEQIWIFENKENGSDIKENISHLW